MSKQYDSEGFMSTPLEGAGARPKDGYHQDVRTMRFDSERQMKNINASKLISLELPELNE